MAGLVNTVVQFIQNIWQSFFEKPVEQWLQRLLSGDFDGMFSQVLKLVIPLVIIFMLLDLVMNMKALRHPKGSQHKRSGNISSGPKRRRLKRMKQQIKADEDAPIDVSMTEHGLQDYEVVESATQQQLEQARQQVQQRSPRRKSRTAEVMRNAKRSLAQDVVLAEDYLPPHGTNGQTAGSPHSGVNTGSVRRKQGVQDEQGKTNPISPKAVTNGNLPQHQVIQPAVQQAEEQ